MIAQFHHDVQGLEGNHVYNRLTEAVLKRKGLNEAVYHVAPSTEIAYY